MRRTAAATLSRRDLLRARPGSAGPAAPVRPPWTTEAALERCTSCRACVDACPEAILTMGADARPFVRFGERECTFCGQCASACAADVFDPTLTPPWSVRAAITNACLLRHGVVCLICADACAPRALRYDFAASRVGTMTIDQGACTGCGACAAVCPVGAIALQAEDRLDG